MKEIVLLSAILFIAGLIAGLIGSDLYLNLSVEDRLFINTMTMSLAILLMAILMALQRIEIDALREICLEDIKDIENAFPEV